MPKHRYTAAEIRSFLEKAKLGVSTDTIAEELLKAFGGPTKFAQTYLAEFNKSPEGGMARSKMLDGVLRMVGQSSSQLTAPDLSGYTDDELQEVLGELLGGQEETASQTS